MTRFEEFSAGWINSSIHDFLMGIDRPPESMVFALITMVDSSPDPAALVKISPLLKQLEADVRTLGTGLLVETRRLLEVERQKPVFFGFDELWFFPNDRITPKPAGACMVGPTRLSRNSLQEMEDLLEWMAVTQCSLGLGDGTGLNFVARLTGVGRYLVDQYTVTAGLDRSVAM
jgi:hypothetical protein